MSEARQLAEDRMREVVTMPFDDLVCFIDLPVDTHISGPSGRTYRSRTYFFWDMEPDESELFTRVEVTGRGLRRYQRYFAVDVRALGANFGIEESDELNVSSAWTETFGCFVLAVIALILMVPWFVGVVYLISRIV